MEPVFIAIAFLLGLAASQVNLPPLVGYLVAGFVLQAWGAEGGEVIDAIKDLGILLLLFCIGLKLQVRSLLRPEVWAGASAHMAITVLVFGVLLLGLGTAGMSMFEDLDLTTAALVAFALSFSSTVFAIKVLDEKGEAASLHGRTAIGILIVQDVIAVVFLTASSGEVPKPWAIALVVGLWVARPLLAWVMIRCGHGELLVLCGLFFALVLGAASFESVGLKPDLGALVVGLLLAPHPRAKELAKSLMNFKDLFLVGFFLSIGLSGSPSLLIVGIATLLVLLVPLKVALFFALLTRFRLRSRSSLLASLALANYSEFGLIVGVEAGWIPSEWLLVIAIALSISFVAASPANTLSHAIYRRFRGRLQRWESARHHPEDRPIPTDGARIIVFGMGRVGTAVYEILQQRYGAVVAGIDCDGQTVKEHQTAGRNIICGDATDADFWERMSPGGQVGMVVLAMHDHSANMEAARQLTASPYKGLIAATAMFDDQVEELQGAGVHAAYNFYFEAGAGFAEHVRVCLDHSYSPPEKGGQAPSRQRFPPV